MTTEVRGNGATSIHLTGVRPMEKLAIAEILEASAKGQPIKILEEGGALVVRLEHATS